MAEQWDDVCDVLVVGSGGGALIGAYSAASRGLKTIVVEATDKFGGTTAYSGSGMWLPGNPVLKRSGAPDTAESARAYYKAVVGSRTPEKLQDAFLETGPKMIEDLERNPLFRWEVYPWPDYYGNVANAHPGRHMISQSIASSEIGELRQHIRPTLSTEREGQPPMEPLMAGQALIGRALRATQDTGNAELRRNAPLDKLIVEGGRVVGGEVVADGKRRRIRARRGVLLAAGGFEHNDELRRKYGIAGTRKWSVGAPGNLGKALQAGIEIGAATDLLDQAWWSPGLMHPDGSATFTVGILGGIIVNGAGKRFADEAMAYDRLGREMLKGEATGVKHLPSWMIWDNRFGGEPPIMNASVALLPREKYLEAGLWKSADTLEGLAKQIGVPPDALVATVNRFNKFAETGVDEDFHRGEETFEKFIFAAADHLENLVSNEGKMGKGPIEKGPNPGLIPITQGPFHAAAFAVSDLGTKGGLKTDEKARVLRPDGSVIKGLYAAGNTMAAVSGEAYPAGGNPVGSSAVFSYLAALDMVSGN